jgi:hypothetical protein
MVGKMISHTYKCIFIHIPKCMGTSIEYHPEFVRTRQQEVWEVMSNESSPYPVYKDGLLKLTEKVFKNPKGMILEGVDLKHWLKYSDGEKAHEIAANNLSNSELLFNKWSNVISSFRNAEFFSSIKSTENKNYYKDFFVFTIKRCPIKRFVSAYKHSEHWVKEFPNDDFHKRNPMSINEYAKKIVQLRSEFRNKNFFLEKGLKQSPQKEVIKDLSISEFDAYHLCKSFNDYIKEAPRVDRILDMTEIKKQWPEVCKSIGMPQKIPYGEHDNYELPHFRKDESNIETDLDSKTLNLIREAFAEDL